VRLLARTRDARSARRPRRSAWAVMHLMLLPCAAAPRQPIASDSPLSYGPPELPAARVPQAGLRFSAPMVGENRVQCLHLLVQISLHLAHASRMVMCSMHSGAREQLCPRATGAFGLPLPRLARSAQYPRVNRTVRRTSDANGFVHLAQAQVPRLAPRRGTVAVHAMVTAARQASSSCPQQRN
jgi:hypothetical protein